MSLTDTLMGGREAAEALMVDACTIKRRSGQTSNPTTGDVTDTYAAAHYTGKCKVQSREVEVATPEAGEQTVNTLTLRVDVPMSATGITAGDVVTITAAVYDPDLVNRSFRVVAPFHGSLKTARRLPVEEVV